MKVCTSACTISDLILVYVERNIGNIRPKKDSLRTSIKCVNKGCRQIDLLHGFRTQFENDCKNVKEIPQVFIFFVSDWLSL